MCQGVGVRWSPPPIRSCLGSCLLVRTADPLGWSDGGQRFGAVPHQVPSHILDRSRMSLFPKQLS